MYLRTPEWIVGTEALVLQRLGREGLIAQILGGCGTHLSLLSEVGVFIADTPEGLLQVLTFKALKM